MMTTTKSPTMITVEGDERHRQIAKAVSGEIATALTTVVEAVEAVAPAGTLRDGLHAQLGKAYSAALHAGKHGKSAAAELRNLLDEVAADWQPKPPCPVKARAVRRYDTAIRATAGFSYTAVDAVTREVCTHTIPRGRAVAVPGVIAERAVRAGVAELLPQPSLSDQIRVEVLQTHRVDDERVLARGAKMFLETDVAEKLIRQGIAAHYHKLLDPEITAHARDVELRFGEQIVSLGDIDDDWQPPAATPPQAPARPAPLDRVFAR